jgi:hypothetical protein
MTANAVGRIAKRGAIAGVATVATIGVINSAMLYLIVALSETDDRPKKTIATRSGNVMVHAAAAAMSMTNLGSRRWPM